MPTAEGNALELERRGILFRPETSLAGGGALTYNADPNLAVPGNSTGEFLLYYAPIGVHYIQSTGEFWYKESTPNIWKKHSSANAVSSVVDQTINGGVGIIGYAYYLTTTDDTWLPCDKTNRASISGCIGVCSDSNTITYFGSINLPGHGLGADGAPLYAGSSGAISVSEPSIADEYSRIIGYIEDADTIRVDVASEWYTLGDTDLGVVTITSADSPFTVTNLHTIIEVNAADGSVELLFPSAVVQDEWAVIRVDDTIANSVTLTPYGAQTINGESSKTIDFQYTSVNVYSNGTNLGIK